MSHVERFSRPLSLSRILLLKVLVRQNEID